MTTLLESHDSVAVKVGEKLHNKSISEVEAIQGLEYCLSQLTENDRILAAKDFYLVVL